MIVRTPELGSIPFFPGLNVDPSTLTSTAGSSGSGNSFMDMIANASTGVKVIGVALLGVGLYAYLTK